MNDSLNDIRLDPGMLESLYRRSLVIDAPAVKTEPAPMPGKAPAPMPGDAPARRDPGEAKRYLGNNARHIVILVCDPGHRFLHDNQLALLTRMLTACKMSLNDVAIVNMADNTDAELAGDGLAPETIIMFGKIPGMPDLPLFATGTWNNARLLSAPGLDSLLQDTDQTRSMKNDLWKYLRQWFQIG